MKTTHAPSLEVVHIATLCCCSVHQLQNNITRPSANHHNNERLARQDTKQKGTGTIAEGLAGTESEGKDRSIRLRFLSEMKPRVYHDDEIKSIRIGIFDGDTMIKTGPYSKLKIELSALEGSFPYDAQGSWTPKEFHEHRAYGRDGKGNVLAGKGTNAQLMNGECHLDSIRFREGSCRARDRKFIIGASVCDGQEIGGRIHEAVTNSVVVKDRRNNEKSHPPNLDDRVYRLEKISMDGKYSGRLEKENICTVEHFLKALHKDEDNLARILQIKKKSKDWDKMVEHAQKCCLEGKPELKSYRCEERNVVLFFNCVHRLVGAKFGGRYIASDAFEPAQQNLVDKLKKNAYDQWNRLTEDHVMKDNIPVPSDTDTDAVAGPSCMPANATQQKHSGHHFAVHRVRGTPAIGGLSHAQTEPSCENVNNGPSPGSSIPDPHRAHNYQAYNTQLPQIQNVLSVGGAAVEGLSHSLILNESPCAIADNGLGPSFSVLDHLRTQDYQDQGTWPAVQEQHSDSLNGLYRLDSLGAQAFSFGPTDAIDMHLFATHEADDLAFLPHQTDHNNYVEMQPILISPGNDTFEVSTSAHINMASPHIMALAPQLTNTGAPASASVQGQTQAPLPSNGTGGCGSSESPQDALPPQLWS